MTCNPQAIIALYQKDNVHLAEAANIVFQNGQCVHCRPRAAPRRRARSHPAAPPPSVRQRARSVSAALRAFRLPAGGGGAGQV